jgi:CO/xanthine dehydrogenase Mo-binding subunit
MGQGARTVLPMLVANELGVTAEQIDVADQDTSIVPDSGPTVASRTTMTVGRMLIGAARRLRAKVEEETRGSFPESYQRYVTAHGPLRVDEEFKPYSHVPFDSTLVIGEAYPVFGWAAAVVEVTVDLDTGIVMVNSVTAVDDAGKIVHPILAEGQVEGATVQAVGYATVEEIKLRDGRYLNDRLQTYIIPTSLDAPRIATVFVESDFDGAPHGAKSVGEMPIDVGAPAVIAAIHDAIGVWVHELPASPERILSALAGIQAPQLPGVSDLSGESG